MSELIEAAGRAFDGDAPPVQRTVLPAYGPGLGGDAGPPANGGLLFKLLRVGHGTNGAASGAPTTNGVVAILGPDGRLRALLDGGTLTVPRAAAVAAHAPSLLAREEASVLAVFGAGGLAEQHVEAIADVRSLTEVRVVGRSPTRAAGLGDGLVGRGFDATLSTPEQALRGAHIVSTMTTVQSPFFADADLEPGTHVQAMGSYKPERAEVPAVTVVRARVVVETHETARHEAGDLIQPRDAGLIDDEHGLAELSERERIAAIRARETDAVTPLKSVGHVALDLAPLPTYHWSSALLSFKIHFGDRLP